jgi:hypothetical protein
MLTNSVLSIISGQGVIGVRPHANNTRLPRFIEMIQRIVLLILVRHYDGKTIRINHLPTVIPQ